MSKKPTRCIDPCVKFCQECKFGWVHYPEWVEFTKWIKELPYSELIIGKEDINE